MSELLLQRLQNSQNRPSPRVILWEPPSVQHPARQLVSRWRIKRLFDLVAVSLAAPVWLPALLLIAIAIKVSAPKAPVFYTRLRAGHGGRRFPMFKFRTMRPDADKLESEVRRDSQVPWPQIKVVEIGRAHV